MPAILTRYELKSWLAEMGNDSNFYHIYFRTETLPECTLSKYITYDEILDFIKTIDKPVYKYLTAIRTNMQGFGPKHSKVFEVMDAENFDIKPYIEKFIASRDEVFIENHYEWCNRISNKTPEDQKKIDNSFKKLDALIALTNPHSNINHISFMDAIDKTLHKLTIKYYPQIFEKSAMFISAYQDAKFYATYNFSSACDKINHDMLDDYIVERYNAQQARKKAEDEQE